MKLNTSVFILLSCAALSSFAEETTANNKTSPQPSNTKPSKAQSESETDNNILDNVYFGGAVRLSLGNYTVIGIEPMVGYRITPKLSTGVSVRYDYIKDSRYSTTHETSQYGGSIFGRYRITDAFYAHIEPATYSQELFNPADGSWEREWVPYLFLGGGYRQPIGERSWLYAQILVDVLQDNKSPYDDWTPFLSIGVGTGL